MERERGGLEVDVDSDRQDPKTVGDESIGLWDIGGYMYSSKCGAPAQIFLSIILHG